MAALWPPSREWWADLSKRLAGTVSVGLSRLLGSRAGDALGILVYHRVAPRTAGEAEPSLNVTPARFRRQLLGLMARGFVFRSLSEVLACRRRGGTLSVRTVVVTFDDGFGSVITHAWPVLCEQRIPATVFLNTAYLDQESAFPFDSWGQRYQGRVPPEAYRPLTVPQCRMMQRDGLIELGAHTHTHRDLRRQPKEFGRDLQTSVDHVRRLFHQDEVTFAFPFGRRYLGFVTDELIEAARHTGVVCGLTTEASLVELTSDPFCWGRFNAYEWDNGATLGAKLEGWYGWAPLLQESLALRKRRGAGLSPA